ncbi:MAG TPA: ROK family protein [bacterium]|nr:ROK family protein [bacterium]
MSGQRNFVIGVDLGGTNIAAGLVNSAGQVLRQEKVKTKAQKGAQEILDRLMSTIEKVSDKDTWKQVQAIGIGSPGPLDPETGVILDTPNLSLKNCPLGPAVQVRFGVPVFVDNDVNVGTLGEYVYGAGRGFRNVVGIFVGTGIGGGLILDGKLWHGTSKNAGEIGHMVIQPDGPLCGCGNRGCLEALASRKSIMRDLALAVQNGRPTSLLDSVGKDRDLLKVRSKAIAKSYHNGDPLVKETLDKAAGYIGLAVKSLVHLLGAELFVLGGGVVEAIGEAFLEPIRAEVLHCLPGTAEGVEVRISALGDQAGILGAAALARTRLTES